MGKMNDVDHPASFDVGRAVEASGFSPGEFAEIAQAYLGDLSRLREMVAAGGRLSGDPLPAVLHEAVNSLRSVGAARLAAKVSRLETEVRKHPSRVGENDLQMVVAVLTSAADSLQAWLDAHGPGAPDNGRHVGLP